MPDWKQNHGTAVPLDQLDIPRFLFDHLDIHRFATTNYDFEIERKTMLRDHPMRSGATLKSPFDQLRALREQAPRLDGAEEFDWDLGSGRIRRVLTHGKAAESDLLNRERIDRLIEFAVGADDVDTHVMHLHGRACNWRSMIVTQRDYDQLYRRNDLNRLPFEFAKRLMMGGNPVLFVGLGMTEDDVNRELREFISNKPYHRAAPAFLLWSAAPGALSDDEVRIRRLDWLHRLGVLTLFDTDQPKSDEQREIFKRSAIWRASPPAEADKSAAALIRRRGKKADDLAALTLAVYGLANRLKQTNREDHIGTFWRENNTVTNTRKEDYPLKTLWAREYSNHSPPPSKALLRTIRNLQRPTHANSAAILCLLGPSGCGKGQAALSLGEYLGKQKQRPCLLINGGFSFDTDSMLNGIVDFLHRHIGPSISPEGLSRSEYFRKLCTLRKEPAEAPIYIILNGSERFFSTNGRPLSAELDELLHLPLPGVLWILFGTERIRRHAEQNLKATVGRFEDLCETHALAGRAVIPFQHMEFIKSQIEAKGVTAATVSSGDWRNLLSEAKAFRAMSAARISGDSQGLREAFYSWALDNDALAILLGPPVDQAKQRERVRLAHKLLRTLAFFGLPVERAVLQSAPAIKSVSPNERELDRVLEALVDAGLILKVLGYRAYDDPKEGVGPDRFALHRSLLAELRRRFGIPLSEAKLSTAFNMSLYVAQLVDGYIPEPAIHDELGGLVDSLLGSYRDIEIHNEDNSNSILHLYEALNQHAHENRIDESIFIELLRKAGTNAQYCGDLNQFSELIRIHQLCGRRSIQCLRGALAVIRGYYSTTGILTLDTGDRLIREDRDGILLEHAERLDRLIDAYGKTSLAREALRSCFEVAGHGDKFNGLYGRGEPFYPDELVWLHNERGVVRLAMGDLYEARASFERALKVNLEHVEFTDRAHNWRRIRLNQLTVEIEMGRIGLTRRIAEEIISVSKSHQPMLQEDELAIAIATGYLGWCCHLQGEFDRARDFYNLAIKSLSDLEEARAQAYFERLRVDALEPAKNNEGGRSPVEKALDLAQSTRQMDLIYRFQISLANSYFFGEESTVQTRQRAHRMLDEAMQYALQTDVHRVRCEASMTIARIRHSTGDHEGALRFASDALMIATRYGMELRKITLRTDIARTMAARGHPVTAQKLALTALTAASRLRFQTALDRAERVLLDIPQISAAIGTSDSSGRRYF